ncbi:putative 6-phosphogluconate dehydrogenase-like domain superfamily, 3-hydroxyacyl-CoA dehydrogenase [Plasmopara halstedii]
MSRLYERPKLKIVLHSKAKFAVMLRTLVHTLPLSTPSILARALSTSAGDITIKKVGMVGLGLMGHGIAQTAATAGFDVVGLDADPKGLATGMKRIENSLNKLHSRSVKKEILSQQQADEKTATVLARITPTTELNDLSECDLIIEAIVENVEVKKDFYANLGQIAKPSAILASNTSSLAISDFAGSSGRASHVVGLHFFNPVQLMKLVEVIRTDSTDPKIFDACKQWVLDIGKHPVSCKDTPGFIVNRLLVPYIAQAISLYERGDASKEDIDVSMQFGAGHPMGPITLADYVGLDTSLFILEGWVHDHPNEPAFFVPKILRKKVAEGKLGRKSGEGFYKWDGDKRL